MGNTEHWSKKKRELRMKKDELITEARAITDNAQLTHRELTESEFAQHQRLLALVERVNADLREEELKIEAESQMKPLGRWHSDDTYESYETNTPKGRNYFGMFPEVPRSSGGFNSLGEYLGIINSGLHDSRLVAAASGMSEGVGADGGFLVPTEYSAGLLDASLENEVVRSRCQVEPMMSNTRIIGGFNTLNHSSSIGGFAGQWLGEAGQMTPQKGLLTQLTLNAKKLGILTAATNELIADSPAFEQQLAGALTQAIGFFFDEAFLTGDGVGKPRGVLSDPALITVAKEASQPADTITWNNIKAMFARLHPASVKNAIWIANPNTRVQLLSMVQHVQNVAGTENVGGTWIPVLRDDGSGGFTILGIPLIFSEKVPQLGDKGDLMLADLSQYVVGLRSDVTLAKSAHVGFDTDETYYRIIVRVDGMGKWDAPVTPKNGDTLSWCVALAERA